MATATKTKGKPRGRAVPQASRAKLTSSLIKAVHEKKGSLSNNDFHRRRHGLYPLGQYQREFGSLEAALEVALSSTNGGSAAPPAEPKDEQLAAAMDKAAPAVEVAGSDTVRGIVTIEKSGVSSMVQSDDITNVVRMIRFVGDDTTADILASWAAASDRLPAGPSYAFTARAGETTISLQIV